MYTGLIYIGLSACLEPQNLVPPSTSLQWSPWGTRPSLCCVEALEPRLVQISTDFNRRKDYEIGSALGY